MRFLIKLLIPLILVLLVIGFIGYKTNGNFSVDEIRHLFKPSASQGADGSEDKNPKVEVESPAVPFVRTTIVKLADKNILGLSGIVKARYETPLAFQISGRIIFRDADTGKHVEAGHTLFKLDARDIQQSVNTAQADVNSAKANVNSARTDVSSAEAQLTTVLAELKRNQTLYKKNVISTQTLEQAQLAERQAEEQVKAAKARVKAAQAQVKAAQARLAQAGNTQEYTSLKSPTSGVLLNVVGEIGQVISAGQAVAVLAQDGPREIEVDYPDNSTPPRTGMMLGPKGNRIPLTLREVSASVDSQSRTLQLRYTMNKPSELDLGSVVRTVFSSQQESQQDVQNESQMTFTIPIAALDERAKGAQVWQVVDGYAQAKPVSIVRLTTDAAIVKGDLTVGDTIISLGTHLLTPGMAVQEISK